MTTEAAEQPEVNVTNADKGIVENSVANILFQVCDTQTEVSVDFSVTPKSSSAYVKHVGVSLVKLKNGQIKENFGGSRTSSSVVAPGNGLIGNFGVDNTVFAGETDYLAVILDAIVVTPGPEPKEGEPSNDKAEYIHEVKELVLD